MTTRSDSPTQRTLSRRTFVGGATAALAAPAILRSPRSAAAATNLDFVIWNYAEDIVQDNINLFQQSYPDVTRQAELVHLADLPRDDGQPLPLQDPDRRRLQRRQLARGVRGGRLGRAAGGSLRLGQGTRPRSSASPGRT